MEILYSNVFEVSTVGFIALVLLVIVAEYFDNGGGPPGSGWGLYTNDEHVKRLNEAIRDRLEPVQ